MMMIGIINWYYNNREENRRRDNGRGGAVALTHHYSPSFQPKTTTNNLFLIPKMLQIFILHIIIIILNLLIIEDFSLQFLFVSLVNHNCAVSFDVNIAITINKDAKHLAVITPQSGFSYQTNTKAHITNSASSVYNKTFTPNIAVIV